MWCCRDADDNFYDCTEGVQRQKQVVPEALDAATLLGQKVCLRCAMLRCAVARCAVLGWAVLCWAGLCCARPHFGDPAVFSGLLVLGMSCSQAGLCCVRHFAVLSCAHLKCCCAELSSPEMLLC